MSDPFVEREAVYRVLVIIPARNKARNLPQVLEALSGGLHEVILFDGHSTNDTIEVALRVRPDMKIVQQTRGGKGNALACGFAELTGDLVVMLDVDGSADPAEIPAFVAALEAGADFGKGTRFDKGGQSHDITRFRRIGDAALNYLVKLLFDTCYTDLCYGYNAFRVNHLPILKSPPMEAEAADDSLGGMLGGDGFEIETLINVQVARAGIRITEIASTKKARLHGTSNLRAVPDGVCVLHTILAERRRLDKLGHSPVADQMIADRSLVREST